MSSLSANLESSDDKIQSAPGRGLPGRESDTQRANISIIAMPMRRRNLSWKFCALMTLTKSTKRSGASASKQASDLAKIGQRQRRSDRRPTSNEYASKCAGVGATSRVKGPVTLDQVYDFTFVKKAHERFAPANGIRCATACAQESDVNNVSGKFRLSRSPKESAKLSTCLRRYGDDAKLSAGGRKLGTDDEAPSRPAEISDRYPSNSAI